MDFQNKDDPSLLIKHKTITPPSMISTINSSGVSVINNFKQNSTYSNSTDSRSSIHANFIWNEDGDFSSGNSTKNHTFEISPLFPLVMILIISTLLFIVIVYRRWPGLCAGIIAGCLTSISVYMLMITLKEQRLVYE